MARRLVAKVPDQRRIAAVSAAAPNERLWLFCFLGSHEGTTARADAAHLDDHSFVHLDKMR